MVIFGGFIGGSIADYTNSLYLFDYPNKKWNELFPHIIKEKTDTLPLARANAGMSIIENDVYIFGGINGTLKLNDLWSFSLGNKIWSRILTEGTPKPRNGFKLINYQNCLIIFGGIIEITYETNDIYCLDLKTTNWIKVEADSSHSFLKQTA